MTAPRDTSRRAATAPRAGTRRAGRDRFGLLLVVLIATYVMSAFFTGFWVNAVQIVAFVVVVGLAVRTGRVPRRTARLVVSVSIAGSAVAMALSLTHHTDVWAGLASLWTALVLFLAVAIIVRRVLGHLEVTAQSIYGALSAYLILGLMFAAIYGAMNKFSAPFFVNGEEETVKSYQYFSFTTLTTLGYGDFTAAHSGGRAIAVMEAVLGQVFLATLVARLVASFRPARRSNRRARRRPPRGAGGGRASRPRRRPPAQGGQAGLTRTSSRARARPARRSPPRPAR